MRPLWHLHVWYHLSFVVVVMNVTETPTQEGVALIPKYKGAYVFGACLTTFLGALLSQMLAETAVHTKRTKLQIFTAFVYGYVRSTHAIVAASQHSRGLRQRLENQEIA